MKDDIIQDEMKIMYEEGKGRTLDSESFRVNLGKVPMRPPVLVAPDTTVRRAAERMVREHLGCVLVAKEGGIAGIFTERDITRKVICGGLDPEKTTVQEVMTPDPEYLTSLQTLRYAVHYMVTHGLRYVPVVDTKGMPIGTLTGRSVLDFLMDFFPEDVRNVPPRPRDFMGQDGG